MSAVLNCGLLSSCKVDWKRGGGGGGELFHSCPPTCSTDSADLKDAEASPERRSADLWRETKKFSLPLPFACLLFSHVPKKKKKKKKKRRVTSEYNRWIPSYGLPRKLIPDSDATGE